MWAVMVLAVPAAAGGVAATVTYCGAAPGLGSKASSRLMNLGPNMTTTVSMAAPKA